MHPPGDGGALPTVELQKLYDVRPFDLVLLDLVVPEDQRISVAS